MTEITKLPKGEYIIGPKEILKSINSKDIKEIIVANNCPEKLKEKIPKKIKTKTFSGNQQELGTKIGKPFPVAMVGFKSETNESKIK